MLFLFGSLKHTYYWIPSDWQQSLVTGHVENIEFLRVDGISHPISNHDYKSKR